jgi:hypothetical protein
MSLVLVTAALGLWRARRCIGWTLALLAPVLAFTVLHMVFVGSVRYRIPLMPMLFVLSAVGVASLVRRRSSALTTCTSAAAPASIGPPSPDTPEDRSA